MTKVTHIARSGGDRKLGSGGDSYRGEVSRIDGKGLVLPGNGCPCPGSKATGWCRHAYGFMLPEHSTSPEVGAMIPIPHVITTLHVATVNFTFSFTPPLHSAQRSVMENKDPCPSSGAREQCAQGAIAFTFLPATQRCWALPRSTWWSNLAV